MILNCNKVVEDFLNLPRNNIINNSFKLFFPCKRDPIKNKSIEEVIKDPKYEILDSIEYKYEDHRGSLCLVSKILFGYVLKNEFILFQ